MKDLERRITYLERQRRLRDQTEHFIPVLFSPWFVGEADRDAWLAEALTCDCQPDCSGKRVGAVLPAKLSPEEWTTRAQQYYTQRSISDA